MCMGTLYFILFYSFSTYIPQHPAATNAATTLLAPHQPAHVPRWQDVLWRRRARAATSLRVG